jgi:hypothetical protein
MIFYAEHRPDRGGCLRKLLYADSREEASKIARGYFEIVTEFIIQREDLRIFPIEFINTPNDIGSKSSRFFDEIGKTEEELLLDKIADSQKDHGCYVDSFIDSEGRRMPIKRYCVLDIGRRSDCGCTYGLKKREDCEYWRPVYV